MSFNITDIFLVLYIKFVNHGKYWFKFLLLKPVYGFKVPQQHPLWNVRIGKKVLIYVLEFWNQNLLRSVFAFSENTQI